MRTYILLLTLATMATTALAQPIQPVKIMPMPLPKGMVKLITVDVPKEQPLIGLNEESKEVSITLNSTEPLEVLGVQSLGEVYVTSAPKTISGKTPITVVISQADHTNPLGLAQAQLNFLVRHNKKIEKVPVHFTYMKDSPIEDTGHTSYLTWTQDQSSEAKSVTYKIKENQDVKLTAKPSRNFNVDLQSLTHAYLVNITPKDIAKESFERIELDLSNGYPIYIYASVHKEVKHTPVLPSP